MCKIRRNNHEFINKLFPKYYLVLSSNDMFLLNAQKTSIIKSSRYVISSKMDNFNESNKNGNMHAELESDLLGLNWNLISKFNKKVVCNTKKIKKEKIRDIYATIKYVYIIIYF